MAIMGIVITWRETTLMAASKKKGDVLFAINAFSDNLFENQDQEAFSALIEEYFEESGDETDANTDNEAGILIQQPFRC